MTTIQAGGFHYAQMHLAAAASIPTGAGYTAITMDTTVRSNGVTVSTSTTSSVTIAREGWYSIVANFGIASNDVGLAIQVNGASVAMDTGETVGGAGRASASALEFLSVNDVVRVAVSHSNAGSVNTSTDANARPKLTIVEVR